MKKASLTILLFVLAAAVGGIAGRMSAPPPAPAASDTDARLVAAVQKVLPATVTFKLRESEDPFRQYFGDYVSRMFDSKRFYSAAGVCVAPGGVVATNAHVVSEFKELYAVTASGRVHAAKPLAIFPEIDLAFVTIEEDLPVVTPCQSDKVQPGRFVFSVGTPFELPGSVSFGVISALSRGRIGFSAVEDYLQTDAAINPGCSGGPLCDLDGNLVGINSAIYSLDSRGSNGIGFAVPAWLLTAVLDKALRGEPAGKAWIGLRPAVLEFEDSARLGYGSVAGVLVAGLPQGSPAAKAGIAADDIIASIDGTALDSPFTLRALLYVRSPGDRVTLEVFRAGVTRKVAVELVAVSADDPPRLYSEEFGASVEKPDEATLFSFGISSGAEVDYFDYRGVAWRLGLRSGDIVTRINGEGFATLVEFRELFLRARNTGTVRVGYIESATGVERESRIEITK